MKSKATVKGTGIIDFFDRRVTTNLNVGLIDKATLHEHDKRYSMDAKMFHKAFRIIHEANERRRRMSKENELSEKDKVQAAWEAAGPSTRPDSILETGAGACEGNEGKPREIPIPAGDPRFHAILKNMRDLHDRKNSDYAKGGKQGALGNFHRVSSILCLYPGFDATTPFGVAIVYMLKQFDAMMILKATKNTSITGEPPSARLLDQAVYTVIQMVLDQEEVDAREAEHRDKQTVALLMLGKDAKSTADGQHFRI